MGLRTCAGNNDLPMGEFWFGTDIMSQFDPWGNDIRTVATAAHVYGRPVVQAESFTSWTALAGISRIAETRRR
jgi:hypothetical protein